MFYLRFLSWQAAASLAALQAQLDSLQAANAQLAADNAAQASELEALRQQLAAAQAACAECGAAKAALEATLAEAAAARDAALAEAAALRKQLEEAQVRRAALVPCRLGGNPVMCNGWRANVSVDWLHDDAQCRSGVCDVRRHKVLPAVRSWRP